MFKRVFGASQVSQADPEYIGMIEHALQTLEAHNKFEYPQVWQRIEEEIAANPRIAALPLGDGLRFIVERTKDNSPLGELYVLLDTFSVRFPRDSRLNKLHRPLFNMISGTIDDSFG